MRTLSIDLETYSSTDLIKAGVHKYVEDSSFEILLFAYAFGDEPVNVIDLAQGEQLPDEVLSALTNPNTIKSAFNASFERTCLAKHLGYELPSSHWRCSSVSALILGLPHSLDMVSEALKLDSQKDRNGKALIRYFSKPCKATKTNGGRVRNLPHHDLEKWAMFKSYCARDVEVERALRKRLERYPVPPFEQRLWQLDQKINDRGVRVDTNLLNQALAFDVVNQKRLLGESRRLTGLHNPNSVAQLKKWLEANGLVVESLTKDTVPELIDQTDNETVKKVLTLRQELAKTSVKKYQSMERALCSDGRVRGLFKFYGARTGRFSSRIVQLQNLPKNQIPNLDGVRNQLIAGDFSTLDNSALSQLTRTTFIPTNNSRFIISDFNSIEARVISWLANERWRLDVFHSHGKIYEASASQMFHVPIESITKGSPLRQKGKVSELALGYGGGVNALITMGALDMGIDVDELPTLVKTWRAANPKIVQLWYDIERAAITAVRHRRTEQMQKGLVFSYESGILFVRLPSGRRLAYVRPRLKYNEKFDKDELRYEGMELGKWTEIKTWGGKLVENIIQAIARDCLAVALLRVDQAGYDIVMHVHDEIVADGQGSVNDMERIMSEPIGWAEGLPLTAEGFEAVYYRKD